MIDICFSDSLGGLLFMARKNLGSDILPLFLHLNYGQLKGDAIENQERLLADNLQCYYPNITPKEIEHRYKKNIRRARKTYKNLERKIKRGESLRVWVGTSARDFCNLYWLCWFAKPYYPKISTVICDNVENCQDVVKYATKATQLTEEDIRTYSNIWGKLVDDDAPLRLLVDGRVISANERYFDSLILQHIDYTPKRQSWIIGDLLVANPEMNYDFWMMRIDCLIQKGEVKIYKNDVDGYGCCCPRFIIKTE